MTPRKTARLLLVDDDPGLLKLLGMRLTSEGYQVDTAESGQQGLRVLAKSVSTLLSAICEWMKWTACSCSVKSRKCSRVCR